MKRPTREQQVAVTRRIMDKQPSGNMGSKCSEDFLIESIEDVKTAILTNQVYFRTQAFSNSPGQLGLVFTFVTCPDEIVSEMHAALDEAVDQVFAKHGYGSSSSAEPV